MDAGTVDYGGGLLNVPSDQNRFLCGLKIRHLHTPGGNCSPVPLSGRCRTSEVFDMNLLWTETLLLYNQRRLTFSKPALSATTFVPCRSSRFFSREIHHLGSSRKARNLAKRAFCLQMASSKGRERARFASLLSRRLRWVTSINLSSCSLASVYML